MPESQKLVACIFNVVLQVNTKNGFLHVFTGCVHVC